MKQPAPPNPTRWWDLPAIFLMLVVLTAAFTRLVATGWTENLDITRTLAYLGLIAGVALGYSRFSPRLAAFFAIVYGAAAIPWRVGLTLGEGIAWQERLISLAGRLQIIIQNLLQQKPVPDNLLFLVLMAIVFWILAIHAGYIITRYAQPWNAVLPTGIALVLIHSYDPVAVLRIWYLVIYLLFALMLVARLVYLHNKRRWEQNNTYTPPYLGLDFVRITLMISVGILALSWTAPALAENLPAAAQAWAKLKEPWREMRNTVDNAFASLRSSVGIVSDYYGPNLALGRGNRLSDNTVFQVVAPEDPPPGTRYYWRARIYDHYENGWTGSINATKALPADEFDLTFPDMEDNAPGQFAFTFSIAAPMATLFTPQQPVWLSRPTQAELAYNPDGTADLASLRATPALRAGESYNVRASLNLVTRKALRQSGSNYPEWVRQRYLQLPDSVTRRTRDLAAAIAKDQDNPYDIAVAVTDFLRTNIEYTESVPPLPANQDLTDWFLFDLRQGFCNYYATAEVLLLRSLGIPARLAVGYAQGQPREDVDVRGIQSFIIRQRDAHAWPEVYFPGVGWVEFEPTAVQPEILRPEGDSANDPNAGGLDEQLAQDDLPIDRPQPTPDLDAFGGSNPQNSLLTILIAAGLTIISVGLVVSIIKRREIQKRLPGIPIALEKGLRRMGFQPPRFLQDWAFTASLSPLLRAYQRLNQALRRLGKPPQPQDTPGERAARLGRELPLAQPPAQTLLRAYQDAVYSPAPPEDVNPAIMASAEIRSLSYKALFRRLFTEPDDKKRIKRF